jgi:methionyl-tRNA formyltransferase
MRIVIITQSDSFFIPANVQKIIDLKSVEVKLIALADSKGAFSNRLDYFAKGFGVIQSIQMFIRLLYSKALNVFDLLMGYKLLKRKRSLKVVAKQNRIHYTVIPNPNNKDFLEQLREVEPDLIVSLSAPCIFNPELLSIPGRGCINLHCSLLPEFGGYLPSFWVLYHEADETGATVHYMDDKIDSGDILGQEKVSLSPNMSMFDVIKLTKPLGGDLMVEVIDTIRQGKAVSTPNESEKGSYYAPPTIEEMKEFRKRGGRFV